MSRAASTTDDQPAPSPEKPASRAVRRKPAAATPDGPTPQAAATRPQRRGPRPMHYHLGMTSALLTSSVAALPMLRDGSLPWAPHLAERGAHLTQVMQGLEPAIIGGYVAAEAKRRLEALLAGVARYRDHPYVRDLPDPPVIWQEGATRLLDYGAADPAGFTPGEDGIRGEGRVALFVPSLVNRHYVMDLSRRRSLMRWLSVRGFRPLLVDWGVPEGAELDLAVEDYVASRLGRMIALANTLAGGPVPVVGYCMGGLLTIAGVQLARNAVSRMALMATPWDFAAGDTAERRLIRVLGRSMLKTVEQTGSMPVDMLQILFVATDPAMVPRKFRDFAALDPASTAACDFVALEDWLNDGVPLAGPVARTVVHDWYGTNQPADGKWRVDGQIIDPAALGDMPVLIAVPERDRIVPPPTAAALAERLPRARLIRPAAGHIGMMVGSRSARELWEPLAHWLREEPVPAPAAPGGAPRRRATRAKAATPAKSRSPRPAATL
ncbi:alpha/beta hydrolase [Tistrella bauzanensis]|nr:alpha/beta fold hydrolase [Tistrella bauzanensis]